ncbi:MULTISPECIES: TetR/AcrR family transcriptional regulator [unclassified Rhodococcus (in: high G+C Gram-positive bacteria)]|uniref:TetR/AcrR family transcriptional regulator n=1 Tax=unclassified Rhodococcus (in: high G+C Gram-positive bacteria) TaxID=192944 RepID=UPI00163AE174|nr:MULTISPECIES: TetR family transcriptional regulator [unclassified Rhodococcus (in: high G+C Gram-positive bacteria)]MBC2641122.1 TetR/AcrR family transcriptional regulator [Rhodococcus sp. 3A]MBC2894133.1 TetR/AcrR family transcriptional regulator [Rhodococcus sp. 4CII]
MAGKREQVLDAAIALLGTKGVRALTHRGVDDLAGMPQGSTSNYFRSRGALLDGIVARLAERDREDRQTFAHLRPGNAEALVEALVAYVRSSTGPDRTRTSARYALFVEASVTPGLDEKIGDARRTLVEWGAGILGVVGSKNPAADAVVVTDYLDGVILHQLTVPDLDFDPTAGITAVLGALT